MHFSASYLGQFILYLKYKFNIITLEIGAETAPSNDAIWDKKHQRKTIQCPICTFYVQIRCKFNSHFGLRNQLSMRIGIGVVQPDR